MPRLKQPLTLETVALRAMSSYIRDLGLRLTASVCTVKSRTVQPDEGDDKAELDMNCMADFLYGDLPHILAARMTRHILDGITEATDRTVCTVDGFRRTGDNKCRNIYKQMIVVGTSSYLTQLDLSPEPFLIRKVLCENLHRLLKLQVLTVRICYGWEETNQVFVRDLALLQNLLSFNMEHDCTDEIVRVLGQNCRKLKCLDVTGAVGITDNSVENILKLKHLQQLHLSTTSMTESGFLQLWNGMIKVNQELRNKKADPSTGHRSYESKFFCMKKLGCSFVRNSLLRILVEHFPCVTQISLATLQCDLSILKGLVHLQELKLIGGNFVTDNVKGLLENKGTALLLLDLLLIQDVDLVFISRCCDQLKVLTLRSCSFQDTLPVTSSKNLVAPLKKLEELTFYVQCSLSYLQFLLLHCINIKIVTVGLIREIDDRFIAYILSVNSMKHLEDFKVYFSNHLSLCAVRLLMANCPQLSVVGGLETWKAVSQQDLQHFREKLRSSNLALSV
jgi:hypothetical protein